MLVVVVVDFFMSKINKVLEQEPIMKSARGKYDQSYK